MVASMVLWWMKKERILEKKDIGYCYDDIWKMLWWKRLKIRMLEKGLKDYYGNEGIMKKDERLLWKDYWYGYNAIGGKRKKGKRRKEDERTWRRK